jgi:hypothetical protein
LTAMRTCVGCTAQLDLTAQLAATRSQPGWRRCCCGYICPVCWATGHWPGYAATAGTTTVCATCGCGWVGDVACERLADVETEWAAHYHLHQGAPQ